MGRWPNGDFPLVKASNKDQVIEFLDEVDNAGDRAVRVINDVMGHFRLADEGKFVFEEFGEMTRRHILRLGYPVLDNALADAPEGKDGKLTDEGLKTIGQAGSKKENAFDKKSLHQADNNPRQLWVAK